jgi:CheY-like chemotaxis protein
VLLVDDHRGVLDRVSALLSDDFEVAGQVSDGREAVEAAPRLDPDLIVLDINMPGFDGFQTIRALDQAGSRAPVVFMSLIDAEEHITEAFRLGGRGYVVKSRIARDLLPALDHVQHGRIFVPSLTALFHVASGSGHAMQVYRDRETFLDELAEFFDLALRRGDATCVITTEEIRTGLGARLGARGWNVGDSSGDDRYLVFDADAALSRFMRNGLPDARILQEIVEELEAYRLASTGGGSSRLTIFGDMVVSLLADGNASGAMALEHLWNTVTRDRPFFTLCGYCAACFQAGEPGLREQACAEHWAVSHAADL